MQIILLYLGAAMIFLWGLGHLVPTRNVVGGFGPLSPDNRRIITMEWVLEGLTLCFLGIMVALTAFSIGANQAATHLVARACSAMLLVMAGVSAVTGAHTAILPMKLCPVVKAMVAAMFLAATFT